MHAFPHIYNKGIAGNRLYAWFPAMHTRVDIMLLSNLDESAMLEAIVEIRNRIADIEAFANCFNPQSELSQYNSKAMQLSELCPELQRILAQV